MSDGSDDRQESEDERLDRKYNDLIQEMRVMQTGAQLTAGFLLTLPFQPSFADLSTFQEYLYLALVLLAAVTTALIMSVVAVHRRLSGDHVKERVVVSAHRTAVATLTTISMLVVGMVLLIFDVVLGAPTSYVYAGAVGLVVVVLLLVVPRLLRNERRDA